MRADPAAARRIQNFHDKILLSGTHRIVRSACHVLGSRGDPFAVLSTVSVERVETAAEIMSKQAGRALERWLTSPEPRADLGDWSVLELATLQVLENTGELWPQLVGRIGGPDGRLFVFPEEGDIYEIDRNGVLWV